MDMHDLSGIFVASLGNWQTGAAALKSSEKNKKLKLPTLPNPFCWDAVPTGKQFSIQHGEGHVFASLQPKESCSFCIFICIYLPLVSNRFSCGMHESFDL